MKRIIFATVFLTILTWVSLFGQVPYLSTTTNMVTSFSIEGFPCLPSKMAFDFEPVNGDATSDVDLVLGKTEYSLLMIYQGKQRYNNGSGDFLNDDGTFFNTTSNCTNETINEIIFGKLRPSNSRRDLAILRQNEVRIYHNTGNGMATSANQVITLGATNGAWGPFVAGDNFEDLVVSDGSQVRAYRSLTNGNLDMSPYTFSITATKILVAQMDEDIYKRDFNTRFDLVSYSGSTVSVRMNNNNNGFSSQQYISFGDNIDGVAVGDINNDGFNDVVVGGYNIVKAYLNSNGTINANPHWSASNFFNSVIPLIGDMGTPTDPNRNDGWNDILVTGHGAPVRIFANNQGTFNSMPAQSFQSGPHFSSTSNAMLVDIQNTGGLSFAYQSNHDHLGNPSVMIHTNKHTGNPAPAPPKNANYTGAAGQHPTITWAPSTERDISGYNVYKQDAAEQWVKLNPSTITGTSWVDNTETILAPNQAGGVRYYHVKAADQADKNLHHHNK